MHNKLIVLLALTIISVSIFSNDCFAKTEIITIEFKNDINGYEVKVFWRPQSDEGQYIVGPAIMEFSNSNESISFSLTNNKFGLLKRELELDFDMNVPLINNFDKNNIVLSYGYNPIKANDNFESIEVPFFFQDVDFDGAEELLITEIGNGQRYRNTFKVYKLESGDIVDEFYNITYKEPFVSLDITSKLDYNKKEVTIYSSGGACYGSNYVYKYTDKETEYPTNKLFLSKITEYDNSSGKCFENVYTVVDGSKQLISKKEVK